MSKIVPSDMVMLQLKKKTQKSTCDAFLADCAVLRSSKSENKKRITDNLAKIPTPFFGLVLCHP